ncbi:MAG: hypothetical protein HYZ32_04805, partial [Hydrocarboniphaga effusa]|nr:hypothetical protein [Hydrocarboniphaga effusa]
LQRSFIETLLAQAGWSYTIVTDPDAFAWELRSGDYSLYALFAESVKLDEPVQKELREAVYRGEGLLDAGSHDQRHQNFDDALGIKYLGKHSSVQGVDVFTTTVGTGSAGLTLKDKTLKAQLLNAVKLGRYIGVSSEDLAIATRDYGEGKSVYMGFDLLAEATVAGDTSFHASLIREALTHVQPSYAQVASGQVVPLMLTLSNRGIAVSGRALLPLPAGSVVVDRRDATVQGDTLTWTYSLAEGEEKTFTTWVRLPPQAGTLALEANVQIGAAPSFADHTTASLTVNTVQKAGLAEARTLAASDIAFKKVQLWLDKADAALSVNKPDVALGDLVQAADEAMKAAHPQAPALRLMIDQAILDIGRRLWEQ